MREIRQGQFYRHFKGGLYQIMAIATHSETKEKMVVYQAMYGDYGIYVRPYEMFASEVDHEKYPQVKQLYRFTQVHPEEMAEDRTAEVQVKPMRSGAAGETLHTEEADTVEIPDLTMELDEQHMEPEQPTEAAEEPAQEEQDSEEGINPILLEFLDADTLEQKMHIMTFYRNQMDEGLLNSIAISLDLVVDRKGLQETYDEIMNCLSMMKHFECTNRFR